MKINQMDAWKIRHNDAMAYPDRMERPIVHMLQALESYANWHKDRYESKLGADYVLGPAWLDMAKGLRTLLNGDCGRLDCGTLDSMIIDMVKDAGFDTEEM